MKISDEWIGLVAHEITGLYGATCCHVTGGFAADAVCECRDTATDALKIIAPLIQAAALEEAAKVADARDLSIMSSTAVDIEARNIAAAIRALTPAKASTGEPT